MSKTMWRCQMNGVALDNLLESDALTLDDVPALLPKTPMMTVKNTFIMDVGAASSDEEDEKLPPVLAIRSCPAVPRQLDEPWKASVAAIEERYEYDSSSDAEDVCDLMLPMRVTRTCSDFSEASLPMRVTRTCSDFSEASLPMRARTCSDFSEASLPMRTRTCSDFSEASLPMRTRTCSDFSEAMAGPVDYDFEGTPLTCVGGGAVDFGVDATSRNGPPGVWKHSGCEWSGAPMANLKVKNTFIDGYSDQDEDEDLVGVPMVASQSCPVPSVATAMQGSPFANEIVGYSPHFLNAVAQQMHMQIRMASVLPWAVPQPPVFPCVPEATRQVSTWDSEETETVSTEAGTQDTAVVIAPLEQRELEWSIGAQAHGTGECRPCAWYWRSQGCLNGVECKHCHLCPAGAIKDRRKTMKSRKQREKASA